MNNSLLADIAYARSGDKGPNVNVGVIFKDKEGYDWGVDNLTEQSDKFGMENLVIMFINLLF